MFAEKNKKINVFAEWLNDGFDEQILLQYIWPRESKKKNLIIAGRPKKCGNGMQVLKQGDTKIGVIDFVFENGWKGRKNKVREKKKCGS